MFNNANVARSQRRVFMSRRIVCLIALLLAGIVASPAWPQSTQGESLSTISLPPALRAAHPNAFSDADHPPKTLQGVAEPVRVDEPAEAGETIDRYAERILNQRLSKPEPIAPVAEPQPAADLPRHIGTLGPANLDLIYIAGTAARSQAYVRIDKRYAKLMRVGEYVAGWRLRGIGVDYVDIVKDDEEARLYLFSSRFEIKDPNAGQSGVY